MLVVRGSGGTDEVEGWEDLELENEAEVAGE